MTSLLGDSFTNEAEVNFLTRNDLINRWGNVISSYLALPGLVGFWPMSSTHKSTGEVYDLSGQGRTLTRSGIFPGNTYNDLVPFKYVDNTANTGYLYRADETGIEVIGNEGNYSSSVRGLTVGGWFWNFYAGVLETLMSKAASSTYTYMLRRGSLNNLGLTISNDGSTLYNVWSDSNTIITGEWYSAVGRFVPSTSIDVYLNRTKTANTTSIPATLYNGTSNFEIGSYAGGTIQPFSGRTALCFLCANALPDALIEALYEQSRVLFGAG